MIPPQIIIGPTLLVICCLISTILAFTVGDRILTGDDNKSALIGTQATYTLCTISCSILCVATIYLVIRGRP